MNTFNSQFDFLIAEIGKGYCPPLAGEALLLWNNFYWGVEKAEKPCCTIV